MELSIAKETYEYSDRLKQKVDYDGWVDFVDQNKNYFIWYEETPDGIHLKKNLDKAPEWAREGISKSVKVKALAEFNTNKGWYEIVIDFHQDTGVVKTTFMKKITKAHLKRLLDMANHLDAYLLNNGNEIIDEETLKSLA